MLALAFLLSAAAATPAASAPKAGYAMSRCIKVSKGDAYRDYMLEVTAKTMQVRANEGDINGWVFARTVMPAGEASTCDFLQINIYTSFPPERTPIDQYLVKAGLKTTRTEWYARLGEMSKLARQELWRTVDQVGEIKKGQYLRVDYFKAPAGKAAAAKTLAQTELRDGTLSGWTAEEIMLPAGSGHGYNIRTLTAYPSWDALGRPSKLVERRPAGHELVKSELFTVVEVVRPVAAKP
jgi:hypothetical protein